MGGLRAGQREGTRNALGACAEAGVRRFVHCGTEAALMAGEPLVHVDETTPLRPDSKAPTRRARRWPSRRCATRAATDSRPSSCDQVRLGQGRHDAAARDGEDGRSRQIRLGRRRRQRHRHRPRRQRRLGPDPRRREGTSRRGLLRHRRRARRLPRVRPRDARDPGRRAARPQPPRLDRGAARPRLRGGLEGPTPARRAADDQVPLLALTQECTIEIGKAREELGYVPLVSHQQGLAAMRTER